MKTAVFLLKNRRTVPSVRMLARRDESNGSASMPISLSALDIALHSNHPGFYDSLAPGTTSSLIVGDISALYRWKNGQAREVDLLDGYTFPSLEQAHDYRNTLSSVTIAQRLAMRIFCRRPMRSIPLLYDICGDGFFYDLLNP